MGEKGSPRPTLPGSPSWDFRSSAGAGGGAVPRLEVEDTTCLCLADEPYPSSINTCAVIMSGLTAEFTIIPISPSDKLRLREEPLVSCPGLPCV